MEFLLFYISNKIFTPTCTLLFKKSWDIFLFLIFWMITKLSKVQKFNTEREAHNKLRIKTFSIPRAIFYESYVKVNLQWDWRIYNRREHRVMENSSHYETRFQTTN